MCSALLDEIIKTHIIPSSQFLWWETEPETQAQNQYASGMMRTSQSHCHSGITQYTHSAHIMINIKVYLSRSYCRSAILPTQSALERLPALLTPCYSSMQFLDPRSHRGERWTCCGNKATACKLQPLTIYKSFT